MLADLVRQQQRGGSGAAADESVARAAKRAFLAPMRICNRGIYPILSGKGPHTARGATKEKAHKLRRLKAKRKAKDDKNV